MKFPFLKLNKNKTPSLKSLRPQIFDTNRFWFFGLGLCSLLIIIMALIGLRLFFYQYFESYKNLTADQNFNDLINVNKLKSVIQKRSDFINQQISLPRDPSL